MLHTLMQGENPGSQTLKPELIIRESTAPLSV
jgi:DNA-binding LacI/PurR family transcriptional regulator